MANDIRGEVGFKAIDKEWTLKLGNGAVRHVENETGKSFTQIGRDLSNEATASISLLTQVFCAALKRHHPDITLEDCDDIIDDIGHEQAGVFGEPYAWGNWHWRYTIPGRGSAPWPELLAVLKAAGYAGCVSIELEDVDFNGTPEGERRGFIAARDHLQTA